MAKETPLQTVKRLYGSKDKLVDAVVDFAKEDDEDKGDAAERLKVMSNRKLLRLAAVKEQVSEYGGTEQLAESLAGAQGRSKDGDYVAKLKTLSATRLLDMMSAANKQPRRSRSAAR